jgi:hypothetical protein
LNTVTLAVPAVAMSAAVIDAVSTLELEYVVVRFEPFQRTTAPLTKLAPFTVRVKADPPVVAELGLRLVIVGVGLLTVNDSTPDKPPPGAGLDAVTLAVPAVAMSAAEIEAVSTLELVYVVVRSEPFQRTTAPLTKLAPFTVRAKAEPPAVAELGLRLVIVGVGLLTENDSAPDKPPPGAGLNTVTLAVPAVAMSAAVIDAVSTLELVYIVARFEPFQRTSASLTKLAPFTVRVKAEQPAVAELGLRLVIVGVGLLTVNDSTPDKPPPGVGLNTVTLAVPPVARSAAVMDAVNCVALT